jgi:hypothetical protein
VAYAADRAAQAIEQNGRVEGARLVAEATTDAATPATLTFVLSGRGGTVQKVIFRFFVAIGWLIALSVLAAPHRPWLSVPFFAFAAAMTWVIETRILRVSVIATHDGLTVRNYRRTRQITWDQITGFQITKKSGLSCELTDGKRVAMKGINQGLFGDPTPQNEAVGQIKRYRDASRESASSTA